MKKTTSLICIVIAFCLAPNICFAKESRKSFNGVSVILNIDDKTPHGMARHNINKNILVNHFKKQLKVQLMTSQYSILFKSTYPHLNINVTINGDKLINKYNIVTVASIDEGAEEWEVGFADYWDKNKNIGPVIETEEYIKRAKQQISLYTQMVGWGSSSSEVENIYKANLQVWKDNLTEAEEILAITKKNASMTGTIKQSLNSIASEFAQYYQLVKEQEREYKQQALEIEDLQNQLDAAAVPTTPHNEDKVYTEPESLTPRNTLYETGTTVILHNPSDNAVAIYRDETLGYMTNLFTNGITATIIDYQTSPGKPTAYKIQIALKDGSYCKGWIPEGVIKK